MKASFHISVCGIFNSTLQLFQNLGFFCGRFSICRLLVFCLFVLLFSYLTLWPLADVRAFLGRLFCCLHANTRAVTNVYVCMHRDVRWFFIFWKLNVRHLQNWLDLQSWGLQLLIWLFKRFNVLFLNGDTQNQYKPVEDFGLSIRSNFTFWHDVFLSGRALKRPMLQADVAVSAEEQGRSSL